VPQLFDMDLRARRRDRAARIGVEPFLHERAFEDCLERIAILQRRFERALMIGSPDKVWPERLRAFADEIDVRDPGRDFAELSHGTAIVEDAWEPPEAAYDLVLGIGTLDTVNDLRLALRLIRYAARADALFIGALSGGDTLPQLRAAMRAADTASGAASPHVHPRIEASALAPLLADAGFVNPVVDIDRVPVSYRSFHRLVGDLRAMAATNILTARPRFIGKAASAAAEAAFAASGDGGRTVETFEILHFAAWTAKKG
jgi:NADH dehydrogenase [ubiquinone] 1 alpha subcomplex assembly factor 5